MRMQNEITKEYFKEYYESHNQTLNLAAIGKELGVTRQRVHQIYSDFKLQDEEFAAFFNRPIPEIELKDLLSQNKTIRQIALNFGVSVSIIKARMKKYEIERVYYKTLLTEESLRDMYLTKNMKDKEIAAALHCSVHTIKQCRYHHGIYRDGGKRK